MKGFGNSMKWFDKLERKYGKYAIKNLMYYIIMLYAFGFVINLFWPEVYTVYFALNAQAILHGQIWRIITFIIQPTSNNLFFLFFSLYLYYMIGTVLERAWGSFKFNVYYFMGVLLHVIAAIIVYLVFGVNLPLNTYYLNLALFMAFAMVQPDMQVLLFFIIPIKIKWMAYLDAVYFGITIIGGYLSPILPKAIWSGLYSAGLLSGTTYACYVYATAALVSMLNFLAFFVITKFGNRKTKTQKNFQKAMNGSFGGGFVKNSQQYSSVQTQARNSQDVNKIVRASKITKHKCAICGKTENDGDDLEFRFCSKCDGNYEYCSEHLYTHVHIKTNDSDNVTSI